MTYWYTSLLFSKFGSFKTPKSPYRSESKFGYGGGFCLSVCFFFSFFFFSFLFCCLFVCLFFQSPSLHKKLLTTTFDQKKKKILTLPLLLHLFTTSNHSESAITWFWLSMKYAMSLALGTMSKVTSRFITTFLLAEVVVLWATICPRLTTWMGKYIKLCIMLHIHKLSTF